MRIHVRVEFLASDKHLPRCGHWSQDVAPGQPTQHLVPHPRTNNVRVLTTTRRDHSRDGAHELSIVQRDHEGCRAEAALETPHRLFFDRARVGGQV